MWYISPERQRVARALSFSCTVGEFFFFFYTHYMGAPNCSHHGTLFRSALPERPVAVYTKVTHGQIVIYTVWYQLALGGTVLMRRSFTLFFSFFFLCVRVCVCILIHIIIHRRRYYYKIYSRYTRVYIGILITMTIVLLRPRVLDDGDDDDDVLKHNRKKKKSKRNYLGHGNKYYYY